MTEVTREEFEALKKEVEILKEKEPEYVVVPNQHAVRQMTMVMHAVRDELRGQITEVRDELLKRIDEKVAGLATKEDIKEIIAEHVRTYHGK